MLTSHDGETQFSTNYPDILCKLEAFRMTDVLDGDQGPWQSRHPPSETSVVSRGRIVREAVPIATSRLPSVPHNINPY
jgi:hypothetical protein